MNPVGTERLFFLQQVAGDRKRLAFFSDQFNIVNKIPLKFLLYSVLCKRGKTFQGTALEYYDTIHIIG